MSSASRHCVICEKGKSDLCGRCKGAPYCSKKCQKADWPVHKLLCASFADFDLSKRPSPHHYRGFHFPEEGARPVCIWMKCTTAEYGELWHRYEDPDTGAINFRRRDMERAMLCSRDPVFERTLPDTIAIHYGVNTLTDGSKPTKSLRTIYATAPETPRFDTRGHYLAVGVKHDDSGKVAASWDLDMKDFRHVANFFIGLKPLQVIQTIHPLMGLTACAKSGCEPQWKFGP